jgi:hypothetical protein
MAQMKLRQPIQTVRKAGISTPSPSRGGEIPIASMESAYLLKDRKLG